MEATVQSWDESGRSSDHCDASSLSVFHTRTDMEFDKWCGSPAHTSASSCLVPDWQAIALAPGQKIERDGEPIIHETLHMLILCSTHGVDADGSHELRWAWKEHGAGTVQGRAEYIFVRGR